MYPKNYQDFYKIIERLKGIPYFRGLNHHIMLINKKIIATLGLSSVITFVALTSMAPADPVFKNLKVLPKDLTMKQLDGVMDEWAHSLGVRCNFCHTFDAAAKKMDFASDAKPEKEMAREMFGMMNKINKKYFKAKKDSLGMMMHSGINCYTCHRGNSHPEVTLPQREMRGPGNPVPPANPGTPGTPTDKKQ
jgi:photosynthetic reaction center cytochrome c subunit